MPNYDDINAIAADITEDLHENSGLRTGISFTESLTRRSSRDDDDFRYGGTYHIPGGYQSHLSKKYSSPPVMEAATPKAPAPIPVAATPVPHLVPQARPMVGQTSRVLEL